jgi:hypothetical protein
VSDGTESLQRVLLRCYFDRNGERIATVAEWGKLYEDDTYRQIGIDRVGPYLISTIWEGLDMWTQYTGRPPLIFETTVFDDRQLQMIDGRACPKSVGSQRYHTEQEARETHAALVESARHLPPDTPPL